MDAAAKARVVYVALVFGLSLLAVLRAPIGFLWKPAVGATEAGYLLALLTIPAFIGGGSTTRDATLTAMGVVSVLLFLSPLVRVWRVAHALPSALDVAFGRETSVRGPAFSMSRLLDVASPDIVPTTHVYAARPGEPPLHLDVYATPSTRPRPVVLVIHGGSWSAGDRTQLPSHGRRLAAAGYVVAAMDYRLAPRHPFPAALDDVYAALDWLRANAVAHGIDPDRVVLYGRSAGGHLALLAAYRGARPYVRGVVSLYAPTDLHFSWANPSNPLVLDTPTTLRAFMGGAPTDSAALDARYTQASPLRHVHAGAPPTLLVHGGRDELVRTRQMTRLAERLDAEGVPHVVLALPWASHGCEANLAGPSGQLIAYAVARLLESVTRE